MSQVPVPSGVWEYAGYFGVAFAGSFLRANKWRDEETGRIVWLRVIAEIGTAVAVGSMAAGFGTYYHLLPPIIGGLCGGLGILGPAFFSAAGDTLLTIAKSKFGK